MLATSYRIYKVPGRIIQPWTLETLTERKGQNPIWVTNGFYDTAAQAATHLQKIVSDVAEDVQYFDAKGQPSQAPVIDTVQEPVVFVWSAPESVELTPQVFIPPVGVEVPDVINPSGV